jgi:hypothetical protein
MVLTDVRARPGCAGAWGALAGRNGALLSPAPARSSGSSEDGGRGQIAAQHQWTSPGDDERSGHQPTTLSTTTGPRLGSIEPYKPSNKGHVMSLRPRGLWWRLAA